MCNRTAEGIRLDVVRETAPAVDLDDRQPLAIRALQLGIAADVDLAKVEVELALQRSQLFERALTEVAALRVVDDDVGPTGRCHA